MQIREAFHIFLTQDPDLRFGSGLDPVQPPAAEIWRPPSDPKFGHAAKTLERYRDD